MPTKGKEPSPWLKVVIAGMAAAAYAATATSGSHAPNAPATSYPPECVMLTPSAS